MPAGQTTNQIERIDSKTLTTEEGINLKKAMAEKIRPNSPGCIYLGGFNLGSREGELYHCFGATVLVDGDSLSILGGDVNKAHGELEKILGFPLIPFVKSKLYQP